MKLELVVYDTIFNNTNSKLEIGTKCIEIVTKIMGICYLKTVGAFG